MQDFGRSWSSGIAMVALIRSINPALIDLRESLSPDPRQNIELAFEIAHRCLDIPPLLESEGALTECIDAINVLWGFLNLHCLCNALNKLAFLYRLVRFSR